MLSYQRLRDKAKTRFRRWQNNRRVLRAARSVMQREHPDPQIKPVIFFNASTRIVGLSLNASYSLLTSWALRMQNIPVIYFVCQGGMNRCVLGTHRENYSAPPPCKICFAQSRWLYSGGMILPLTHHQDAHLAAQLEGLGLAELMKFEYQLPVQPEDQAGNAFSELMPLGALVLPSIRWALRRHSLEDDEATRFLFRQYILSAAQVAGEFSAVLSQADPQAVVLFNGQFFPEATARWLALKQGVRAITHEVGLQPFSAFFTPGEATAYPLHVPDEFTLSKSKEARLDAYLSMRFQGQFSMAGVRFWPEMRGLDQDFLDKAAEFKQIVPVFTNVIFDTSQPHSNIIFPHMFAWLDLVLEIIRAHPDTLFVVRAHPDEARPGKTSQESVRQWVVKNHADQLPNLVFVDAHERLSSYELIQRSKFILVYNSTIGLEASIMGLPVLCAGRARYTQLPTVFFPATPQEFQQQAEAFLAADEIDVPPEFKQNARRFLYYQLYRSSLSFSEFIEPDIMQGFVHLRKFNPSQLTPKSSATMRVLVNGILHGQEFLTEDND